MRINILVMCINNEPVRITRTGHSVKRMAICLKRTAICLKRTGHSVKRMAIRLKRTGYSAKRTGHSVKRMAIRLKRTGYSVKRTGYSVKRTGYSMKRTGYSAAVTQARARGRSREAATEAWVLDELFELELFNEQRLTEITIEHGTNEGREIALTTGAILTHIDPDEYRVGMVGGTVASSRE